MTGSPRFKSSTLSVRGIIIRLQFQLLQNSIDLFIPHLFKSFCQFLNQYLLFPLSNKTVLYDNYA